MSENHGEILKAAATAIAGRRAGYGEPRENHERAATIASVSLGRPISAYDVAMILHAVKLARIAQSPGDGDHYTDGVSYLAFAGEFRPVEAKQETRSSVVPVLERPRTRPEMSRDTLAAVETAASGRPVLPIRAEAPKSA